MKTLIVQKRDRDPIPAVYLDQAAHDRQFQRGDVIDVLPSRYMPSPEVRAQDWCAIYCNGLTNSAVKKLLHVSLTPGRQRRREFYVDLDAIGFNQERGFEEIDCSVSRLLAAVRPKPTLKKRWIIG